MTVIGEFDKASGDVLQSLYEELDAPIIRKDIAVAEMIKYTCNVWHATKVTFANEIGNIAKAVGVDGREVMEVVCQDKALNLSQYYMRPGFAFGGSCLPKEVKGFLTLARDLDVPIPTLSALLDSNEAHIKRAYDMIARNGRRNVALFGLAFKPGTDDMRDSPLVVLAERLLGKGYTLSIFDRYVKISRLLGKNKQFIEQEIPHLDRLLKDTPEAALDNAEVIVIGHADAETRAAIIQAAPGRRIVDLSGYADLRTAPGADYEGICW
jgi:GDP-mannose 6-dehydrogenase